MSKSQKSVTLSSSEAEYVALSETAKEIRFLYQLLKENKIEAELPIVVKVDNIGAIFMAENISVSPKTKHVDIRYRFVNDMVGDKFLEVIFVGSIDNDADLFTKNVKGDLYEKHSSKIVFSYDLSALVPRGGDCPSSVCLCTHNDYNLIFPFALTLFDCCVSYLYAFVPLLVCLTVY